MAAFSNYLSFSFYSYTWLGFVADRSDSGDSWQRPRSSWSVSDSVVQRILIGVLFLFYFCWYVSCLVRTYSVCYAMPRLVSRFSASSSLLYVLDGRDISAFWWQALVTWMIARTWKEWARFVLRLYRKAARVSMENIEGWENSWPLPWGRGLVPLAGLGICTRASSGVLSLVLFVVERLK